MLNIGENFFTDFQKTRLEQLIESLEDCKKILQRSQVSRFDNTVHGIQALSKIQDDIKKEIEALNGSSS